MFLPRRWRFTAAWLTILLGICMSVAVLIDIGGLAERAARHVRLDRISIAFGLAAWGSFAWLAGMSSVVRLAVYVLSIACLPFLRRKLGPPPVRLPGGYAIPVIAIVVCLWLLAQVTLRPVLVTLAFLAAGTALYALAPAARRRRNDGPDADR